MTRFSLMHESRQSEAGVERPVKVRIVVMASGELAGTAQALGIGSQVKVSGFVETRQNRQGVSRLVLNASRIEQV